MASYIRARSEKLQDFEQKLNVVYLIHDVLYHTFRNRQNPAELDDYAMVCYLFKIDCQTGL